MINKRLINTGVAAAAAFDPYANFETVTYTGNGSTQKITGYIRKGAAFNGSSSYITASKTLFGSGDGVANLWSLSLWFRTTSSSEATLLNTKGGSGTNGFFLYMIAGGYIRYYEGDSIDNSQQLTTTGTYNDGNWHHLVATRSGSSDNFILYIDGSEVISSTTMTNPHTSHNYDLHIGRYGGSAIYYWNGNIDQIRIFNKAISSSEVTTLYGETYASSTKSTTDIFNDGSAIALYELDEDANDTGGTYNGTPTNVNFLGMAFQPDLVWIKDRGVNGSNHVLSDSVRGASKFILPNLTNAEITSAGGTLSSFDSNGFTLAAPPPNYDFNINGNSYVAWCFKGGGSAVSNTNGTITSQVSANQAAGFSIVKYTGNATAGATVGHGLSSKPELIFIKNLDIIKNWIAYDTNINNVGYLNLTDSFLTSRLSWGFNNTLPTSTVVTLGYDGGGDVNSNNNFIMYCFHSVDGYQKVGSYTGNGGSSVNSITTGFEPRFLIIKRTDTSGYNWVIYDSIRDTANPINFYLNPNTSDAESGPDSSVAVNFVSNGFEIPTTSSWAGVNGSGATIIYLAIA